MAGSGIEIKVDTSEVERLFSEIQSRCLDLTPVMRVIGETIRTSVMTNFEQGGRPQAWKPLSEATLKRGKSGGGILRRQGMAGGLMGSIHHQAFNDRVVIGTNKVYAAIHQFGGKAGRGHKVTIPARPYLMIQDGDWAEITEVLKDYILEGQL